MNKVTTRQLMETAFWLIFAIGAYILTFNFDEELEIYEFGAAGWPRAMIFAIAFCAIAQLAIEWRRGGEAGGGEEAAAGADGDDAPDAGYRLRATLIIGLPIVYAFLLEPIGFYTVTPVFIAAFVYIGGERNWKRIAAVTVGIYAFLLILFAKILYVGLPAGTMHPFYDFSNWLLVLIR
ncbi:MAG: tripartite tricarboxylate transporter TctB family protein [Magnetovibrio sp.]|nr:tripartite tricarboxylate transporter TctB family protein [Magnetovibrio sp.]